MSPCLSPASLTSALTGVLRSLEHWLHDHDFCLLRDVMAPLWTCRNLGQRSQFYEKVRRVELSDSAQTASGLVGAFLHCPTRSHSPCRRGRSSHTSSICLVSAHI